MSFFKVLKNKQHHKKIALNGYHLYGHTVGFHPQTQKLLNQLLRNYKQYHKKNTAQQLSFE